MRRMEEEGLETPVSVHPEQLASQGNCYCPTKQEGNWGSEK